MAESLTKARAKSAAARESNLQPLQIKYYRRMKPGKTYPLTVAWKKAERGLPGSPVTIRPLVGGAVVVPAEQPLSPADPNAAVTFHVTPLGRGRLTPFRVEILQGERKIQEIALSGRAVSQRWTWIFLLLALVSPWFILRFVKSDPWATPEQSSRQVLESFFHDNLAPYPDLFRQYFPDGEDLLGNVGPEFAALYADFQRLTLDYPVAYYAFLGFLGLTILSLWLHRDKRKRKTGPPIPYARPARRSGEGDDDE